MFLRVGKASFLRCHCIKNCVLYGHVTDCDYELGGVFVFFLNGSWLCVLEGQVAVALQTSRCSHSSPAESACHCPSCLLLTAGRNQSRLAWWRTLQEQFPANGNYFKTNWCGFSVKPTWSINKVGLWAASLDQPACLECGFQQCKHGLESKLSLCLSDLKSKSSKLSSVLLESDWLKMFLHLSSCCKCQYFCKGFKGEE